MADSSEPAFLFLYRKEAVAPVDYLSTFATAPQCSVKFLTLFCSFLPDGGVSVIPATCSFSSGLQSDSEAR